MQRRWIIIGLIACALAVAAAIGVLSREREPKYNGKSLSEWILIYQTHLPWSGSSDAKRRASACEAIRQIGDNALPFLIQWIRYRPSPVTVRARALLDKAPLWVWRIPFVRWALDDGAETRASTAVDIFELLGPAAATVAPALITLLDCPDPEVSSRASRVLGYHAGAALATIPCIADSGLSVQGHPLVNFEPSCISLLGTNALPAVRLLARCLNDRDAQLAAGAARALGWMHIGAEIALPPLIGALHDPRVDVRAEAANALSCFGRDAKPARGPLLEATNDENEWVANAARRALDRIERDSR